MVNVMNGRCLSPALLLILMTLAGVPAYADQTDRRLDPLFARLKDHPTAEGAQAIESEIREIWRKSGSDDVDHTMGIGERALAANDVDFALSVFDQVVNEAPAFAEAWNKRATGRFLAGDFTGSVSDIQHTLALEPRHFGALAGLGQIYLALHENGAALKAFEAALEIDPALASVRSIVKRLRPTVQGEPA
jgi:tetratricopeptide (TPR) repeat protein